MCVEGGADSEFGEPVSTTVQALTDTSDGANSCHGSGSEKGAMAAEIDCLGKDSEISSDSGRRKAEHSWPMGPGDSWKVASVCVSGGLNRRRLMYQFIEENEIETIFPLPPFFLSNLSSPSHTPI